MKHRREPRPRTATTAPSAGASSGGDLRLHRGLGTARRLPPRLQHHRHLRRPARRQRLSHARSARSNRSRIRDLPAGRQQRPEHLRRRLVDGQPGDGARADVRRLRREPRLGRRRPQRQARHRDLPRRHALALEGLPDSRSRPSAGSRRSPSWSILIPGEDWETRRRRLQVHRRPGRQRQGRSLLQRHPEQPHSQDRPRWQGDASSPRTPGRANGLSSAPTASSTPAQTAGSRSSPTTQTAKATVIADEHSSNDLASPHDGDIYVTDPGAQAESGSSPRRARSTSSTRHRPAQRHLLSPDQTLLYVADTAGQFVYSFQIQPDGSLAHKQQYFHLHLADGATQSGADGMTVDTDGRLYVTTELGLQVCDQAGRVNGIIPKPQKAWLRTSFSAGRTSTRSTPRAATRFTSGRPKPKACCRSRHPFWPPAPRL